MANQRQLRIIARNLVAKLVLVSDFDVSDTLTEKDEAKLQEHIKQVAYSVVKKCYRASEWESNKIVNEVLKNVK